MSGSAQRRCRTTISTPGWQFEPEEIENTPGRLPRSLRPIPLSARGRPARHWYAAISMASFILNVTFDAADPRRLAAFWSEVTGYRTLMESDDFVALEAPDQRGVRRILFFRVPEPKVAKSRMHVDLASKDPVAEVDRLVALGATKIEARQGNGTSWTVMLDPEGNEFCIG